MYTLRSKLVKLPYRDSKEILESVGVEWKDISCNNIDTNPFLADGKIPCGWNIYSENAKEIERYMMKNMDKEDCVFFYLVDEDGFPRVSVWIKSTCQDQISRVKIIDRETSGKLKMKFDVRDKDSSEIEQLTSQRSCIFM